MSFLNQSAQPGNVDLLVFEVAAVRYAIPLACVREVLRAVLVTPLPEAPAVVEGVIDVRGQLVPVVDLRLRFGHPPRPLRLDDRLIVAWTGERLVSMRCERTEWIETVDRGSITEPPYSSKGRIAGVAQLPEGVVLIQDLPAFLDQAESDALDTALAARSERDAE